MQHYVVSLQCLNLEALSKDEILRLLRAAKAYKERDWLALLVAYNHGLRESEVVEIMRSDIAGEFLTVRRLKGSFATTQRLIRHENPLLDERAALIEYAKFQNPAEPIFPVSRQTIWRMMQRHGDTAQIPEHKRHPHILKASIVTHLLETLGVHVAREWVGHRSLNSTGHYSRLSADKVTELVHHALGGL